MYPLQTIGSTGCILSGIGKRPENVYDTVNNPIPHWLIIQVTRQGSLCNCIFRIRHIETREAKGDDRLFDKCIY